MKMKQEKLTVIDGETLADLRLPPTRFCVQTLLPQGVSILGARQRWERAGWCWTSVFG